MERIRNEARALPLVEREALLTVLDFDLRRDNPRLTDEREVEDAWDDEIASGTKQVEDGTVELIWSEEVERGTDKLFASPGPQRPPHRG